MEMELEKSGPSSEELALLDREVQDVTKKLRLSPAEQIPLFVELRGHILFGDDRHQQPYIAKSDTRGNELLSALVNANIGLAKAWVRRRRGLSGNFDDYLQEALMGLRKGVLRFDPTRGVQPSGYLSYWIRQAFRSQDDATRTIYVPFRERQRARQEGRVIATTYSYDGLAERNRSTGGGVANPHDLGFMADGDQITADQSLDAVQGFYRWKQMLRHDLPSIQQRYGDVDLLLFSMHYGLWRYPDAPVSVREVAERNNLTKSAVRERIDKITRVFAHRQGLKRKQLEPILHALVEYSLHAGLPT